MEPIVNNQWQSIKNFINSKKKGSIITRKDLISLVFGRPMQLGHDRYYTFDKYRGNLAACNILETVGRGKYKIKKHIPTWMNSKNISEISDAKKQAYWYKYLFYKNDNRN